MKRIFSIVLAISMLFAMAVTVNAATTGSMAFSSDVTEVTVGEEFTVTLKYIPGADSAFKGGTIQLKFDDTIASFGGEVSSPLNDVFTNNTITNKPANHIYAVKHSAGATDDWQSLTSEDVYSVVKFTALTAGTFELTAGTSAVTFADAGNIDRLSYKGTSIPALTITVKEPAPAGPAAPTYGTPVHDYSDVTVGDVIYQNVYVGTYTATPDTGATIAKVGVKAGETVVGEKDITVDGDATVSFKIALLGVEDGIDVGLTAFAEYAE